MRYKLSNESYDKKEGRKQEKGGGGGGGSSMLFTILVFHCDNMACLEISGMW